MNKRTNGAQNDAQTEECTIKQVNIQIYKLTK